MNVGTELFVTHVKGEGVLLKFWGLSIGAVETVRNYEAYFDNKTEYLDRSAGFISNDQTPIGFKCAVRSRIRKQWCRAIVFNTSGLSEVVVQLMDYGIIEQVSVADVRSLDETAYRYGPQARECILGDVIPSTGLNWSMDAIKFCEKELLYSTMSCVKISEFNTIPIVRIAKKGETEPFVQKLINSGLALIKLEKPAPPPLSYTLNSLNRNSIHLVKVSFIESQHKFYVQLVAAELELNKLQNEIHLYCSRPENLVLLNSPQVGLPCLAEEDKRFFRGLITGVNHGRYMVSFVDYGCVKIKEFKQLAVIPPRFITFNTQAIACTLPREMKINSDEFIRVVQNYVPKNFECHILGWTGEVYIVHLKSGGQDIFVPNQFSPSSPLQIQKPKYDVLDLTSNLKYEVVIGYINDISEFYCQLVQYKEDLETVSSMLNSDVEHRPIMFQECLPKMPVVVKFSEDHTWYRAQIVKINHEHDIEVFFVDFGNYDNATLRDVRRMSLELMKYPVMAFKCSLADITVPSESSMKDEMFDYFEELTAAQNLQMLVKDISGKEEFKNHTVVLQEKTSSLSVNDKIENKFSTFVSLPVSDKENLFVTSFTSLDSFFGQFEKISSSKLDMMQEDINAFYEGACNTTFRPKPEDKVCAKFNEDCQYYRARVESVSANTCNVIFLDYGNKSRTPLEDVHPMDKKFLQYPQFGVECALQNSPPTAPVDKIRDLMLENFIQVKMVQEKNNKWIVSLVEDFSTNVPILELLRQQGAPRSIRGAGLRGYQEEGNQGEKMRNFSLDNNFNSMSARTNNNVSNNDFSTHNSHHIAKNEIAETPKDYVKLNIPPKASRNVYVSYVISPSEFYCQIEEESTKLQTLMKDIEDCYSNIKDNELNLHQFKVGLPCCAVFQEDGAWYRASIQQSNPKNCEVFFVDYGNTDLVPVSQLKALKPNLMELPPQALKCALYNTTPENGTWSEAAIDEFSDLTLDKSFVAQFVEVDGTDKYAVRLINLNKLEEEALNKQFSNLGQGQKQTKDNVLVPKSTTSHAASNNLLVPKATTSHAASNNLSFQYLDVQIGSSEAVTVHYGLNPKVIFCQLKSYESDFKRLMENIQNYYNKLSPSEALVDRLHSGMICVSQFYQDLVWYRAQVTKMDKNAISVLYVDYGNTEVVDKKKLRYISQDFISLPVQCIKCHIEGIAPPGDSWKTNNVAKYYEGDALCEFISKEEDYYYINLTVNHRNIAEQLVRDGIAKYEGQEQNISATVAHKPSNAQIKMEESVSEPFSQRETLVQGQLLPVAVSYNESPLKFWCQSLDESDILDQLMADIQNHIEQGSPSINANKLKVGLYCLAKYSEDETWYRAQIRSCVSNSEYEVFFIDYGNTEATSINAISELPVEFKKIHPLCIECQLFGATTVNVADKIAEFEATVNQFGHDMTAKIEKKSGDTYIITLLYEVDDVETNVGEVLFGGDIDVSPLPETKFLPPDVPLGLQEGYITIVNSPHDFFIQLAGCEDSLAELAAELSDKCESMESGQEVLQIPVLGCACAAKFSEDDSWYRAEIVAVNDSTAEVLFVDYGNSSTVPVETLKILDEKFLAVPPYAIRCKLNGIIPVGEQWSEAVINTFQDSVLDCVLGITFICKDIPAVVNVSKEEKDIAQNLVDLELACIDTCTETNEAFADDHLSAPIEDQLHSLPFDQSYPKRKLASTELPVKICYVDSYSKFFVMPLELSTELDTVMKTLEILYSQPADETTDSSVSEVLEEPRPQLPCVAKYSEDEAWYRALITDIEGDNIYVSFVDYGNSEVSTLNSLKPLTPELLKIPPIAMECSLYAIIVEEGKEQELTAKLEEYFLDEVELKMEVYKPEEPYKIRLYRDGCDIAEMLCQDGLAKEVILETVIDDINTKDMANDNGSINVTDDVKEGLSTAREEKAQHIIQQRQITGVNEVSVYVKHIEIVEDRIQIFGVTVDLEEELTTFQKNLQTAYNESQAPLDDIQSSCFCVAKYLEDENWYRAKVLSVIEDSIKVQFIDYGNSEVINRSDIKELLQDFSNDASFSVRFSPLGLIVKNSDEVQALLDQSLYDDLVQLQLCKYSHDLNSVCFTSISSNDSLINELLNNDFARQVFILNANTKERFEATIVSNIDSTVYILPAELKEKQKDLQDMIKETCSDLSAVSDAVNVSRLYAANIDNHWNRVSVTSVSENDVEVICVDYGVKTSVELSQLAILPEVLRHEPLLLQPSAIKDYQNPTDDNFVSLLKRAENGEVFNFEIEKVESNKCLLLLKLIDNEISDTNKQLQENVEDDLVKSPEKESHLEAHNKEQDNSNDETVKTVNLSDVSEQYDHDPSEFDEDKKNLAIIESELNAENDCLEENKYPLETESELSTANAENEIQEAEEIYYPEETESDLTVINAENNLEAEENNYSAGTESDLTAVNAENNLEAEENNYSAETESDLTAANAQNNLEAEENNYSAETESDLSAACAENDYFKESKNPAETESELSAANAEDDDFQEAEENFYPAETESDLTVVNAENNLEAEENNYSAETECDLSAAYAENDNLKEAEENNYPAETESDFSVNTESGTIQEFEKNNYPAETESDFNAAHAENNYFQEAEENQYSLNICNEDSSNYQLDEHSDVEAELPSSVKGTDSECNEIKNNLVNHEECEIAAKVDGEGEKFDVDRNQENILTESEKSQEDFNLPRAGEETYNQSSENNHEGSSERINSNDEAEPQEAVQSGLLENEKEHTNELQCENDMDLEQSEFAESEIMVSSERGDISLASNQHDVEALVDEMVEVDDNDISQEPESARLGFVEALASGTSTDQNIDDNHINSLVENECDERPECDIKLDTAENQSNFLSAEPQSESVVLNTEVTVEHKIISSSGDNKNCTNDNSEQNDKPQTLRRLSSLAGEICIANELKELAVNSYKLSDSIVTISHVTVTDGSLIFPVSPKNLVPKLLRLQQVLQQVVSLEQPSLSCVSVSNIYAVCIGGEWYRAKVLGFSENEATVILIDYGSHHTLDLSSIRELQEELKAVPPFAFWCVLASAYCPPQKAEVVESFLNQMLKSAENSKQDLSIQIVQNEEPYKVSVLVDEVDLLACLLEQKVAVQKLADLNIVPGEHIVKITHVRPLESKGVELFFNLVSELDNIVNMSDSMQKEYSVNSTKLPAVDSGTYAVQHKGLWQRGKVISSGDDLFISLVDTGENIELVDVYLLIPRYCLSPPYSISCEIEIEGKSDISQVFDKLIGERCKVQIEVLPTKEHSAKLTDEEFLQRLHNASKEQSNSENL